MGLKKNYSWNSWAKSQRFPVLIFESNQLQFFLRHIFSTKAEYCESRITRLFGSLKCNQADREHFVAFTKEWKKGENAEVKCLLLFSMSWSPYWISLKCLLGQVSSCTVDNNKHYLTSWTWNILYIAGFWIRWKYNFLIGSMNETSTWRTNNRQTFCVQWKWEL